MTATGAKSEARFFKNAAALRTWFEKNHDKADELWLGLRKKNSGLPSVTYKEAVDQALCFGWIDGISNSIDETSYRQRFTPRRKTSTWSAINIARIGALKELELMHAAGLDAFEKRDPKRTNQYSFEQGAILLAAEEEKTFRANKAAWSWWEARPPGYRRQATWWVISAKKDETRERRLKTLISDSAEGRRLKHLVSKPKRDAS